MDGVAQAVSLLRSMEVTSVSAVGMRMGATIVGRAAGNIVIWDFARS